MVRVKGVCRLEFEAHLLYPSKESFDRRDNAEALWLDLDGPLSNEMLALSGKEVVVDARFDASTHGHLDAFAGTLIVQEIAIAPR